MTGPQAAAFADETDTRAPLAHLRVLDLSRILAGPWSTQALADLGAEVIKVERPGQGDDTRGWGPPFLKDKNGKDTREAAYYLAANRGKKSLALDISTPEGQEIVRKLAASADILVENYKVGGLRKYGLDYESLSAVNPRLIYCSITGFGQTGPYRDRAGYDFLLQGMGGLMSVTGEPGDGGTKAGVALVDVITGLHATLGVLAALRHRDRTGEGQQVEVSLLSSLLSALANQSSAYAAAGVVPEAMGNRHPSVVPYEVFQASDRPIVIAAGNDRQFRALCTVLDRPGLAEDPSYATNAGRVVARDRLVEELNEALSARTADEWFGLLSAAGVPCGPINDLAAAFALADDLGLEPAVEIDGVGQVANPLRLSATPPIYRLRPPSLGQDEDWLRKLLDR